MHRKPAYQPFYCEENIWRLIADGFVQPAQAVVLVVTNRTRSIAVWTQRLAPAPDEPVLWDYHVVCIEPLDDGKWVLWDLDSALPIPCPAAHGLASAYGPTSSVPARFRPMFRWTPASRYQRLLASDRRHMRDDGGHWLQPPPSWGTIGDGHNLDRWLDLDDDWSGEWMNLEALTHALASE